LARAAHSTRGTILGRGIGNINCDFPDFDTGFGNPSPCYAFCAQAVEVEVDTETGRVWVLNSTVANDSGVIVNPLCAEGQHDGCVAMGFGQTMMEELIYDEKGNLLNPNFIDYKIPRSVDMPKMNLIPVETFEPSTVYGVKEAGEAPQASTYAAIVSAIYDAIGVWIRDLPVTPEKVLKALKEKALKEKG